MVCKQSNAGGIWMSYLFNDQANGLREEFVSFNTKIISVVSGKGGVGKSIFSVNVATMLASYDKMFPFDSDAGLLMLLFF